MTAWCAITDLEPVSMSEGISRRSFIKIAAGATAAALPGCEPAARKLIPYVIPDENVTPGIATYYATTCAECAAGCGIVGKVREGRVINLWGNPIDPISQGAICPRGQATLQDLYNPDRLARPMKRADNGSTSPIAWHDALKQVSEACAKAARAGEDRVAIITGLEGPTLNSLIAEWLKAANSQRRIVYEPLRSEASQAAANRCFGRTDAPVYQLDQAEFIVSFSADFLESWGSTLENNRQYAAFRAPAKRREGLSVGRSVYVGPRFSLTAAKCDEWLTVAAGAEAAVGLGVLRALVDQNWISPEAGLDRDALKSLLQAYDSISVSRLTGVSANKITEIANWIGQADGALAISGTDDPTSHFAAMLINAVTGNVGRTMKFLEGSAPIAASTNADMAALIAAMKRGEIDVVLIAGVNPIFTLPASAGFADALRKTPLAVWCGGTPDETAGMAQLMLPIHHNLEGWGDFSPRAGIEGLAQPVTAPVFDSRPLGDVLLQTSGNRGDAVADMKALVEARWRELHAKTDQGASFDDFWVKVRREGGLRIEAATAQTKPLPGALSTSISEPQAPSKITLAAFPHIFLYDGRGANKPWLQETPEPISRFVWDTWAEIHLDTAKRLEIEQNDLLEIATRDGGRILVPAYVSSRIAPNTIAVPIGQGHSSYGRYASNRGANPFQLLAPGASTAPVEVRKIGEQRKLVTPTGSSNMMARPIVESMSLDQLVAGTRPREEEEIPEPFEMYDPVEYKRQWGMTIDVNACTGCSACITACYAENNVPTVGKDQVERGRIMAWIRLERFFPQKPGEGRLVQIMPMLCQQCNHAPCEPVCPVYASYHTEEGLNGQVYNRCVGTRYCENNCPYKVRQFNFYPPEFPEPLNLQLNPDVTVRGAGVMEKCTFCVQRIRAAEIEAGGAGSPISDGTVITACAQACPTKAIVFGDIRDDNSAMMRRRAENEIRSYFALGDLNTQPAIAYLRDIFRKPGAV